MTFLAFAGGQASASVWGLGHHSTGDRDQTHEAEIKLLETKTETETTANWPSPRPDLETKHFHLISSPSSLDRTVVLLCCSG